MRKAVALALATSFALAPAGALAAGGDDDTGPPPERSTSAILVSMLPFGAGQLVNHDYILSGAFAFAEVAALYTYESQTTLSQRTVSNTNGYVVANCAGADISNDQQSACADYISSQQQKVQAANRQAQYGLVGFTAFWIAGVVEALVTGPPPAKKQRHHHSSMSYDVLPLVAAPATPTRPEKLLPGLDLRLAMAF